MKRRVHGTGGQNGLRTDWMALAVQASCSVHGVSSAQLICSGTKYFHGKKNSQVKQITRKQD